MAYNPQIKGRDRAVAGTSAPNDYNGIVFDNNTPSNMRTGQGFFNGTGPKN